jgi:hypothetical protein
MMFKNRFRPLLGLLCLALPAAAQTGAVASIGAAPPKADGRRAAAANSFLPLGTPGDPVGAPFLGYLSRPDGSIFGYRGVPGGAGAVRYTGPSAEPASVAISSAAGYLLTIQSGSDALVLTRLSLPLLQRSELLPGHGADLVVVSARGPSALAHDRESGRLAFWTGLPDEPSLSGFASVAGLPGAVTALAVSDDGLQAVAAFSEEGSGAVYLLTPGGEPFRVTSVSSVRGLAYRTDSHTAYAVDYEAASLLRLDGTETAAIAGAGAGLRRPLGVAALSRDRIAVLDEETDGLLVFDEAGALLATAGCACAATGLAVLSQDTLAFTANRLGAAAAVDLSGAEPHIYYLPVSAEDAASAPSLPLRARRR